MAAEVKLPPEPEAPEDEAPGSLADAVAAEGKAPEGKPPEETGGKEGGEETPEGEEADGDGAEETPTRWMQWLKEATGEDLTGQYKSDTEAIMGLLEARRTIGRRDEDAQLGRKARERWDEFTKYLESQEQKQKAPQTPDAPPFASHDEYMLALARVYDDGGNVKANAPPELVRKVDQVREQMQRRIFDLAVRPDNLFQPVLEKQNQQLQQLLTQREQQNAAAYQDQVGVQEFEKQHAGWIFANKQNDAAGLTAAGQRLLQHFRATEGKIPTQTLRLQYAMGQLALESANAQAASAGAAKKPTTAKRKPNVASATKTEVDLDKKVEEMSMAEYIGWLAEQEKGKTEE